MAGKCALAEPGESLRMSKTVVESSERPKTVLVGTPSGKSQIRGFDGFVALGVAPIAAGRGDLLRAFARRTGASWVKVSAATK